MKPKLVIFDCDGTIVDSQHMIVAAMEQAFQAAGVVPPAREAVLSVVGLSLPLAVTRLLPAHEPGLIARISEDYKAAFGELRRHPELREPLYPGLRAAIVALAERDDVVLGVATGKSRRGVATLFEREGLSDFFVTIQTADTHPSKPHPSMILEAMSESGVDARQAVMIGDTTYDIEMALAAEVGAIGVTWGYHAPAVLEQSGAHALVEEGAALPGVVDLVLKQLELRDDA